MLVNKKSQGTIIDLILLVLITSIFLLFLSHQLNQQSIETGTIRSQNVYTQNLLISTLNYRLPEGNYKNASIASLIGMNYCGEYTKSKVNETVTYIMNELNKPNYYFLFTACPNNDCSEDLAICSNNVGSCCVETKKINVATFNMSLPEVCNYDYVIVSLGIWPKTMEVKKC